MRLILRRCWWEGTWEGTSHTNGVASQLSGQSHSSPRTPPHTGTMHSWASLRNSSQTHWGPNKMTDILHEIVCRLLKETVGMLILFCTEVCFYGPNWLNVSIGLGNGWPPVRHQAHDDVIKWRHFPRYWPFVRGIHRSPVNSPHKGQWRGAFMFSLIYVWINDWVNNREAGDFRRHRGHHDVIVMVISIYHRKIYK